MDEVHALAGTKRGDQLALCVARLMTLAPACRRVGLSATVAHPAAIRAYVGAERVIEEPDGAPPELDDDAAGGRAVLGRPHGAGGGAGRDGAHPRRRHDDRVRQHARPGGADVPGAVEAERADAADRAASRLAGGGAAPPRRGGDGGGKTARRGGDVVARSRHRLGRRRSGDPGRRAEGRVAPAATRRAAPITGWTRHRARSWCRPTGSRCWNARPPCSASPRANWMAIRRGRAGWTCWRSICWAWRVRAPFRPDDVYAEVRRAAPYAELSRKDFDDVLAFVENGGYALAAYERWRKLFRDSEGRVHVRSERIARQHRMNIGTIVEAPLVKVRLVGKKRFGPLLGEIEEYFVNLLRPGDTFMFAGRLLRFLRLHENVVECAEGGTGEPMVPAYEGGRLPLTTNLAEPRARAVAEPVELGAVSRGRAGMAEAAEGAIAAARPQRPAGGDVPARRSLVSGGVLLRGPQRAPDAGHAADAAHGARGLCTARFRRDRLRAGHLVGRAAARRRRSCSTRTCWATIWSRGWRKAPCCGGRFAMSR